MSIVQIVDNHNKYELLKKLLKTVDRKTNSTAQFYYQYNKIERNDYLTTFEELMDLHLITIQAHSLEDANILNIILNVIIDDHVESFYKFIKLGWLKCRYNILNRKKLI